MATGSTKTDQTIRDFEAATERARDANDRLRKAGRKASTAYLDGAQKYVSSFAQFERKLGEQSHVDAVASLLVAHADLTEEITDVSVSAARELISA